MMPGPWMLTAGGRDYVLATPAALLGNAPDLKDIAHHLAQINRYNGACSRPYSVAEHSLLVERIGEARGNSPVTRLALLMHDAHEAYCSDMTSPSKEVIGTAWQTYEATHALNVRRYFGLQTTFVSRRQEITACDLIALATERRDLMPFDSAVNEAWPVLDTPGAEIRGADIAIDPDEPALDWRGMRDAFINRYLLLRELVQRGATASTAA